MEHNLDEIAEGKIIWFNTLKEFYYEFEKSLTVAFKEMPKKEAEKTGKLCPECGSELVIRKSKYGEFVACSNYPKCKHAEFETPEEIIKCPNCDGKIVEKKSKRGKSFYGCNNYPNCKTAYWDKPVGENCPECNSMLVEKNKKIKCSNCDYTRWLLEISLVFWWKNYILAKKTKKLKKFYEKKRKLKSFFVY